MKMIFCQTLTDSILFIHVHSQAAKFGVDLWFSLRMSTMYGWYHVIASIIGWLWLRWTRRPSSPGNTKKDWHLATRIPEIFWSFLQRIAMNCKRLLSHEKVRCGITRYELVTIIDIVIVFSRSLTTGHDGSASGPRNCRLNPAMQTFTCIWHSQRSRIVQAHSQTSAERIKLHKLRVNIGLEELNYIAVDVIGKCDHSAFNTFLHVFDDELSQMTCGL